MKIQSTAAVLLVRPTTFGFDEQTAVTNTFQNRVALGKPEVTHFAEVEFQRLADTLEAHDIQTIIFEDEAEPPKPNAVFPNNWLSMWPDGRLYLYPMATKSRRLERSPRVLMELAKRFQITKVVDLSNSEQDGKFLESTGVMVFDHVHKIVYGCESVRCDEKLFRKHATELGYEPMLVHAFDQHGAPMYHANLLIAVQRSTAVVCLEAIADRTEREAIRASLVATGHEVVDITLEQLNAYCANVLELHNAAGEHFLLLSRGAYEAFTPAQRAVLGKDKTLVPVAVPIIEKVGGGSVRCMMAEIFLPPKVPAPLNNPVPHAATISA
ncbi:MAG TPA: arginine deiminase-related protein [Candidatus Saccharimonadales bacterium]|jgi:hypothetical protein|nr:arginine deiminase-related protein [Candidatus Saccharimonadales bacterium]